MLTLHKTEQSITKTKLCFLFDTDPRISIFHQCSVSHFDEQVYPLKKICKKHASTLNHIPINSDASRVARRVDRRRTLALKLFNPCCVPQKLTTNGLVADASADVKYLPQTSTPPLLHIGRRVDGVICCRWHLQMHLQMHLSTCKEGKGLSDPEIRACWRFLTLFRLISNSRICVDL